jgi:hypothetical protein
MSTDTGAETEVPIDPLSERLDTVSTNIRQLFKAAVDVIEAGGKEGKTAEEMLIPAMSLLESALYSLNEIADAQQRITALAEREHVLAMEAQKEAKAEAERIKQEKTNQGRSYIGKPR